MKLLPHVVKLGFPLVIGVAAIGAVTGWLVGADHAARAQVAVVAPVAPDALAHRTRPVPGGDLPFAVNSTTTVETPPAISDPGSMLDVQIETNFLLKQIRDELIRQGDAPPVADCKP